jgi:phage gp36-like protein
MAYSTTANLNIVWGKDNIIKWADANNTLNAVDRAARIAWAIECADAYIDARLRRRGYTLPLSTVPVVIRELSARLAGIKLYGSPRGMADENGNKSPMQMQKEECDAELADIVNGYIKLDVAMTVVSRPFVVKDTDTVDAATADVETLDDPCL